MLGILVSPWWDHLAFVAVVVGLAACVSFVVRYQTMVGWTWWRLPDGSPNYFGRFMMERKVVLAALFALLLAGRVASGRVFRDVPDTFPGQGLLLAALLWVFAVQTFVPYRLLIMAQESAGTRTGEEIDHDVHHRESGDVRAEPGR